MEQASGLTSLQALPPTAWHPTASPGNFLFTCSKTLLSTLHPANSLLQLGSLRGGNLSCQQDWIWSRLRDTPLDESEGTFWED